MPVDIDDASLAHPVIRLGPGVCMTSTFANKGKARDETAELLKSPSIRQQPAPRTNEYPFVVDELVKEVARWKTHPDYSELVEHLLERKELGIQRYKTALQPHNGRSGLVDAYQEYLDGAIYLYQVAMERGETEDESSDLHYYVNRAVRMVLEILALVKAEAGMALVKEAGK